MAAVDAIARPFFFGLALTPQMADPATATDQQLVRWARRGEPEAVAQLVERHSRGLHRYLTGMVGEPALAEDVLQDTWLRVMERLDRYNTKYSFRAWLYAVARNRAIDLLRQRTRLSRRTEPARRDAEEWTDPVERVADPAPSPLEQLAEQDLHRRVVELLPRLPAGFREVLTLRFQEDLMLDEIATVLKLPAATVRTRLYRGLKLLRQRAEGLR